MELNPATEEILYQKVGIMGRIVTEKVKLSDLEYVDKDFIGDTVFKLSTRSAVDHKLIFRVKTTDELLMFDRDGLWHEEGLNHELMI